MTERGDQQIGEEKVRLDSEMNVRLYGATKRLLFHTARPTNTTAAAMARGYVEAVCEDGRWADALKNAGLLRPSERARSRAPVTRSNSFKKRRTRQGRG
jgi:hypothetical protein